MSRTRIAQVPTTVRTIDTHPCSAKFENFQRVVGLVGWKENTKPVD